MEGRRALHLRSRLGILLVPTIGWKPPWIGVGGLCQEHIFLRGLKAAEIDLDRLMGAFEAITDKRFEEYLDAVPDEWKAASGSADQIIHYLIQARDNREGIVAVIRRLLR